MYVLGWKVAGSAMLDRLTPRRVLTHVKGPVVIEARQYQTDLRPDVHAYTFKGPQRDGPVMSEGERSKALRVGNCPVYKYGPN